MEYKIIHTRETDNYTRYLKELSEKGFRVISAGMTANPALKCFDWWAVLEQTPAVVEKERPEDKTADLLEAARKIAEMCKGRVDCLGCPLANEAAQCRISNGIGILCTPESWPIMREG